MLRKAGVKEVKKKLTSHLAANLMLKADKLRVAVKGSRLCKHRRGLLDHILREVTDHNDYVAF
jgi:hypothetical protein